MPAFVPWLALVGCCCVHLLPVLPAWPSGSALAVGVLAPPVAALAAWRCRGRPFAVAACVLLAAALCTAAAAGARLAARLPPAQHGAAVRVSGIVVGVPETRRADGCRFRFVTARVNARARRLHLRVTWPGEVCVPRPGERWELVVRLYRPRGLANPVGFDYEGWLFREGLDATAWVHERLGGQRLAPARGAGALLARLRLSAAARLGAALPASAVHAAPALEALTLGLRGGLSPAQRDALAATGTAHLFAISGLHVGMVAALVLFAARRLSGRLAAGRGHDATAGARVPRWPVVPAFLAALLYAALAGFSLPTQRALVALAVVLGAFAASRPVRWPDPLGWGVLTVLALDPLAPLDPGFWLSFGAIACLALVFHPQRSGAAGGRAARTLRGQLAVWLGLLPVTLAVFGEASLLAPLVNLVAVPLFGVVIVPLSLAAMLASLLAPAAWSSLAGALLWAAGHALLLFLAAVEGLARLPLASLEVPRPAWTLAPLALALALVLARGLLPGRALAPVLCLPLLLWQAPRPAPGTVELTLLDVGQGLAAVLRTRSHTLLYDAGPRYRSGSSTGRVVVVPWLRRQGVHRLDRIIVSHPDMDHRGGVADVLARYPHAEVRLGGGAGPWPACRAGERWRWDGVLFEILHPPAAGRWTGNDGSCVLRVSVGAGPARRRLLLPGDVETRAEEALVARFGAGLRADVVVAPHHGSGTSSSAPFVAATAPALVLFPVGYANRWGFPAAEVLERWRTVGAGVNDTASDGALTLRVAPDGEVVVEGYRQRRRRYWTLE